MSLLRGLLGAVGAVMICDYVLVRRGHLDVYTPEMIESRVEVRESDMLRLNTGWERFAQFGSEPDAERYIHRHP